MIHLGHNRSVDEIVTAAIQEDVQGVAVSSYQGGHVEYFKYMVDLLRQRGRRRRPGLRRRRRGHRRRTRSPSCTTYGVARIFSPEDGQRLGLQGMIGDMVARCDVDLLDVRRQRAPTRSTRGEPAALARVDHRARRRAARRPRRR